MPLKYKTNEWTEFQTGATTLALHISKPRTASTSAPREMIAGTSTIGFNGTDLDKTYRDLKAKNVRFVMEPKLREEEGIKLDVCLDPYGLENSISETDKHPLLIQSPDHQPLTHYQSSQSPRIDQS